MGAVARLAKSDLNAAPGGSDTVEVTVTNTGTVVDQFTLEPLGDAAAYFTAEPATLSLFPGASGTSTLRFAPPRAHSVAAGLVPFAVRILSHEDPAGSAVEEGRATIGRFDDAAGELIPRTQKARGRSRAKYQYAVDNRGNGRLNLEFVPVDPDQKLDFDLPPSLVVEPGEAAFLPIKVRSKKGFWRGSPQTHGFQVVATGGGQTLEAPGSLLQDAIIPKWVPKTIAALIALVAVAIGLWFGVLKPKVKDYATDAANNSSNSAAAAAKSAAAQASQAAAGAQAAASNANAAAGGAGAGGAGGKASGKPSASASGSPKASGAAGTAGGSTLDTYGNPEFYRLAATAAQQAPSITFPDKQVFSLTDIVLENPNGDSGTLTILRGTDVLMQTNLANFRDLDYHFIAPWEFDPKGTLTMKVDCTTPGSGTACTPAVSINGFTRAAASPSPSATPSPSASV